MSKKAIKHIILVKRKINARKKIQKVRDVDDSKKSYIHTPKPQILSVEPRKIRFGAKAIPCVLGEEGRIKRL